MLRPLLGHLQVLWENRSKRYLYFNALWDHKLLKCCASMYFNKQRLAKKAFGIPQCIEI